MCKKEEEFETTVLLIVIVICLFFIGNVYATMCVEFDPKTG